MRQPLGLSRFDRGEAPLGIGKPPLKLREALVGVVHAPRLSRDEVPHLPRCTGPRKLCDRQRAVAVAGEHSQSCLYK